MERDYYEKYDLLEKNHWWHKARLIILKSFSKHYLKKNLKILNIGVATGETSIMLNYFGEVTSLEYDQKTYDFLVNKEKINPVLGSATSLPFNDNHFDCICCFDVLEHINDDHKAISEIFRCLKPNGKTLITVPAYSFLWSAHDKNMHHYRRYTKVKINNIFNLNGFTKIRSTYFNFLLFHPIFVIRKLNFLNKKDYESFDNGVLNNILFFIFKSEKVILKYLNFPYGVSILSIFKK